MNEADYHMTASILSQPAEVMKAVERNMDGAISFAASLSPVSRPVIYLVGTGSSFHAAELAAYFFNGIERPSQVIAVPVSSYEFVNYLPEVRKEDAVVVISHRGYKSFSNSSLKICREKQWNSAAVTGFGSTIADTDAQFVFRTVEQEKSSAHTVSLTTALGILYALSVAVRMPDQEARSDIVSTMGAVAAQMEKALEARQVLHRQLSDLGTIGRVWISGTGPNKTVAREGALKIQETSYIDAYGFELEQMIHGPMRAASLKEDLFIPVIWGGRGERTHELISSLDSVDARIITVSDSPSESHNCIRCGKGVDEQLSPFITLIPMQLTALSLALLRGTDPDTFRRDDPFFSKIDSKLRL